MSLRSNPYYGRSLRDTSMETTNALLFVVVIELAVVIGLLIARVL